MDSLAPPPLDEALLRRAIDQSTNLIVVTDTAARIVYVNPRFTAVTGYTFEEALGLNPRILQSGNTPPSAYEALWKSLISGGEWRGEFENRRKDGSLYRAEVVISAVRDKDGVTTHFLALQKDVTEARRDATALAALTTELEQRVEARTAELAVANRHLAAINRELEAFTHTLVHDVRRHLRTVASFSAILSDELGPTADADTHHLLAGIESGCGHIDEVVTALGRLSRVERALPEPAMVDVTRLALDIEAGLREAYSRKGVATRVEVEQGMTVHADPVLLRLALENLIENAMKYSSTAEAPWVRVSWAVGAPGTLMVRDNGIGFSAGDAEGLFRPFNRLEAALAFPGDGLGLTTVRRIAERHGGAAWAEPSPGGGATFFLHLGSGATSRGAEPDERASVEATSR